MKLGWQRALVMIAVVCNLFGAGQTGHAVAASIMAPSESRFSTQPARPALVVDTAPAAQTTEQIYALPGRLRTVSGQPYSHALVTGDDSLVGLYGETPDVEMQITQLASQGQDTPVKVWGVYSSVGRQSGGPEILVSAIQADSVPATPAPTVGATPTAIGRFDFVNVRSGPANEYAVIGRFSLGQVCPIVARTADTTWIQIECEGGFTGWVQSNVVTIQGDLNSVPIVVSAGPTVVPTATPTPAVFVGWKSSYFTNRDLAGSPAVVVDSPEINFDWGTGSPHPIIPPNNFSARYERTLALPAGNHRFSVRVDDGVRVWLDNVLILDDWRDGTARDLFVDRSLAAGDHQFRVEYFQASGSALIRFSYDGLANPDDWLASYFNNTNLAGGPPVQRVEARTSYPLDRNWGTGSPVPGLINSTDWSGRWQGNFFFEADTYVFNANSDDGVRVYIDGQRVIDGWTDGLKQMTNRFYGVGRGEHQIVVDFYQRAGNALVRIYWYRDTTVEEQ